MESCDQYVDVGRLDLCPADARGMLSWAAKYRMSKIASPARETAASAAETNERFSGYCLNSDVCDKNTRRGGGRSTGMAPASQPREHRAPGRPPQKERGCGVVMRCPGIPQRVELTSAMVRPAYGQGGPAWGGCPLSHGA
jgi:hypothetical protein